MAAYFLVICTTLDTAMAVRNSITLVQILSKSTIWLKLKITNEKLQNCREAIDSILITDSASADIAFKTTLIK